MTAANLGKLQVVVTGVDAAIARDLVRLLTAEGASVIAADRDAHALARLDRDLGLFLTPVETSSVDLANPVEVRLWESSLSAFGRLPHLLICCCGAAPKNRRSRREGAQADAVDVALGEPAPQPCPAELAREVLQPTLFLHAEPLRGSVFERAIAALRRPTLRGVLQRAPGSGVFNPSAAIPYVRIASHLYSVSRPSDGEAPRKGRFRLHAPGRSAQKRASAA